MKSLSNPLLTELGKTITQPVYLVELGFATPIRYSSGGDISFNGSQWTAANLSVRLPAQDGKGFNGVAMTVGNPSFALGALILQEGWAGKSVNVWVLYAGATSSNDGYLAFKGYGDTAEIGDDTVQLIGRLTNTTAMYSPRRRINAGTGFTTLIPAGARLTVGATTIIIERNN